jgi:hypothetical protein
MKKIMLLMIITVVSFAEVRGMILNKDKLLVPKTEEMDPKKALQKKIKAILEKSKQVKELSKRYLEITLFYKNKLLFKIEKKDFNKQVRDDDIKFIISVLEKIEKGIDETKLVIIKEKKKIVELEKQI